MFPCMRQTKPNMHHIGSIQTPSCTFLYIKESKFTIELTTKNEMIKIKFFIQFLKLCF